MSMSVFVEDLSERVYHAHESISKSGLDRIERSPAHFKLATQREPTAAMLLGTAFHRAALEPDRFDAEYVVCDARDRRSKEYKELAAERGAENVLMRKDYDRIIAMRNNARSIAGYGHLLGDGGSSELSAFTQDPETGVEVRCRYDLLNHDKGRAVDLKSARDPLPRGFSRSVATFRYHVQVAFYSDIYEWITGERLNEFWLLAVEGEPPYTPVAYLLDDEAIEAGRRDYRRNLNTYAECLASGCWPHFEPEHPYLSLPEYMLGDIDELEV